MCWFLAECALTSGKQTRSYFAKRCWKICLKWTCDCGVNFLYSRCSCTLALVFHFRNSTGHTPCSHFKPTHKNLTQLNLNGKSPVFLKQPGLHTRTDYLTRHFHQQFLIFTPQNVTSWIKITTTQSHHHPTQPWLLQKCCRFKAPWPNSQVWLFAHFVSDAKQCFSDTAHPRDEPACTYGERLMITSCRLFHKMCNLVWHLLVITLNQPLYIISGRNTIGKNIQF